jgi:hypothetical protein
MSVTGGTRVGRTQDVDRGRLHNGEGFATPGGFATLVAKPFLALNLFCSTGFGNARRGFRQALSLTCGVTQNPAILNHARSLSENQMTILLLLSTPLAPFLRRSLKSRSARTGGARP